jgi:tRNA (guanine37-N1)-methyltransferase
MIFNIITIFPQIFDSYFNESILARAKKEKLIDIKIHNLRDFTADKHSTVDDTPYGGGAGMILKIEPIWKCVQFLKSQISNLKSQTNSKTQNSKPKTRIILFSAKGKKYTQRDAERLKKYDNLIMICGRYEGVDERVAEHVADEEFSIGEYVLTGGEIPAMAVVDSVSRLLPGVLGNKESLSEESYSSDSQFTAHNSQDDNSKEKLKAKSYNLKAKKEYPHYTKPEEFNGWKVPEVLKNGNHAEIEAWRKENKA